METKFCIHVINSETGQLKAEVIGPGHELQAALMAVMSRDPKIKELVLNSLAAIILDEIGSKNDPIKSMLEKMNDPIKSMLEKMNIELN